MQQVHVKARRDREGRGYKATDVYIHTQQYVVVIHNDCGAYVSQTSNGMVSQTIVVANDPLAQAPASANQFGKPSCSVYRPTLIVFFVRQRPRGADNQVWCTIIST